MLFYRFFDPLGSKIVFLTTFTKGTFVYAHFFHFWPFSAIFSGPRGLKSIIFTPGLTPRGVQSRFVQLSLKTFFSKMKSKISIFLSKKIAKMCPKQKVRFPLRSTQTHIAEKIHPLAHFCTNNHCISQNTHYLKKKNNCKLTKIKNRL